MSKPFLYLTLFIILLFTILLTDKEFVNSNSLLTKSLIQGTENYKILNILKRVESLYTQGIFFEDDGKSFYESGGLYRKSSINQFKYPSLELVSSKKLSDTLFAEGIAKCNDIIYQLTWKENIILKYDKNLNSKGELPMGNKMNEGWGLSAYKDNQLIGTDGSSKIYVFNCLKSLSKTQTINVEYENNNVDYLNAIVYANEFIYANKYYDTKIYKIDPNTGHVVKTYEMSPLIEYEISKKTLTAGRLNSGDVLNGIAFNPISGKFLVTGKRWGFYYEVEFN